MNHLTRIEKLVAWYTEEITFDCHQIETRISRSQARREIRKVGREALVPIANEIKNMVDAPAINYDLYLAYVALLFDLIEEYNLPAPPYESDLQLGKQDPMAWIEYCKVNG